MDKIKKITPNEEQEFFLEEAVGIKIGFQDFLKIHNIVHKDDVVLSMDDILYSYSSLRKNKKQIRLLDPWGGFWYDFERIDFVRIDKQTYEKLQQNRFL